MTTNASVEMWPIQSDEQAASRWARALQVIELLAANPFGLGGACIRARSGPVRDQWVARLKRALDVHGPMRWHRLPLATTDDRLLGGLDLQATLAAGRPVSERGLLAQAHGGVLQVAMAERVTSSVAARLAAAMDAGSVRTERDGIQRIDLAKWMLIVYDESLDDDECPPAALLDRVAFMVDLSDVSTRMAGVSSLDTTLPIGSYHELRTPTYLFARNTVVDEKCVTAICQTADALGVASLRSQQLAVAVSCTSAAIAQRDGITEADLALAAQLVLAPRATRIPEPHEEPSEPEPKEADDQPGEASDAPPPPPPPQQEQSPSETEDQDAGTDSTPDSENQPDDSAMSDRMVEASRAALSATLLRRLGEQLGGSNMAKGAQGRYGRERMSQQRGRPLAPRRGDARHGGRVHVLATVRAAAPWQAVRRELRARRALVGTVLSPKLLVERDDWHVSRRAFRSETLTVFAVDASGSAALHRLAEAKGAVELLLAECYIRRDQVALVSFRGKIADVLLPPTRSLVRAKRSLTALPGGGGTPLASGIDQAVAIAEAARRRGMTATIVFLTDGRANIARDGTPGRPQAALDALDAAKRLRAGGYTTLMIDTSPQPQEAARMLAEAMRGRYLGLPYAAAPVISAAVRAERAKMAKNP